MSCQELRSGSRSAHVGRTTSFVQSSFQEFAMSQMVSGRQVVTAVGYTEISLTCDRHQVRTGRSYRTEGLTGREFGDDE